MNKENCSTTENKIKHDEAELECTATTEIDPRLCPTQARSFEQACHSDQPGCNEAEVMDKEALHSSQDLTHPDEPTVATMESATEAYKEAMRVPQLPRVTLPADAVSERRGNIAAALHCLLRDQPFPECHQAFQMMLAAKVIGLPEMLSCSQSSSFTCLPSQAPPLIPPTTQVSSTTYITKASAAPGVVSASDLSSNTSTSIGEPHVSALQNQNTEFKKIYILNSLVPDRQNLQQEKKFARKLIENQVNEQHDRSQSETFEEMEQLTLKPNSELEKQRQSEEDRDHESRFTVYETSNQKVLNTKFSDTELSPQNNKPLDMIKHKTPSVAARYETPQNETPRPSTDDQNKLRAEDISQPDTGSANESWNTSAHGIERHTNTETLPEDGLRAPLVLRPTPKRMMAGSTCIAGFPQQHGNLLSNALFKTHLLTNKEDVVSPIPVHQLHPYYHSPHKYPALHQASFVKLHHHLHYHHHGSSNSVNHPSSAHLYQSQQQHSGGSTVKRRKMAAMSGRERSDLNYRASEIPRASLDIAACDGPVFFERVLNKAFAGSAMEEVDSDAEIVVDDLDPVDAEIVRERPPQKATGGLKRQQHRQHQVPATTYHCVYCNHTFKSHYCYQKHMRRHINPITVEVQPRTTAVDVSPMEVLPRISEDATTANSLPVRGGDVTRDENCENSTPKNPNENTEDAKQPGGVFYSSTDSGSKEDDVHHDFVRGTQDSHRWKGKDFNLITPVEDQTMLQLTKSYSSLNQTTSSRPILDLNVQYFPCKTCGSKFPSYYFVHKHRRLCHGERSTELRDNTVTVVKPKLAVK